MSTKERGNKALRAVKALGIDVEKAKSVLRRLLKLYNKNWELIEEENYRALIDAIFESEEAQVTEEASPMITGNYDEAGGSMNTANGQAEHSQMKIIRAPNEDETEEEQETEALARPLKRLRHKYQDGQSSSPLIKPKDEPNELPEVINRSQDPVSSKTFRGQGGSNSKSTDTNTSEQIMPIETLSPTHPTISVSPNVPSKRKRPLNESPSRAPHPEGPRAELDIVLSAKKKSFTTPLIKIKDEPVADDVPLLEAPLAVICPEQSNGGGSSSWNGTVRGDSHLEPSGQSAKELETNGQRNNGKPVTVIDENASATEVASSPLRDVKILISCNAALQKPGFQVPSLQAVLKAVEDKCLKSYKILDPNFSVMNIMKDMCQSFLELGSKSNTEQPKALDVTLAIDLMNKLSANCNSNVEVPLPDTPPIPLHHDGSKDGAQPNRINGGDTIGTDGEETENAGQTNNMSLVLAQQAHMVTPVHVDDVAKGYENVGIPLVNEVDDSLPPSFYYLSQNVVSKSANVNFTLSCIGDSLCITCSGDCCSSVTSCGCAVEGEFCYTKDGYVKEEILNECISMKRDPKKDSKFFCEECPLEKPIHVDGAESCKGHLIKKFIKECWIKCGCYKQCGNRIVQRGITRKLQVFMTSEGKGWGLRTLEDIPKGAFVCEYVGEILTLAEFLHSSRTEKGSCPVLLDADWSGEEEQKGEKTLCLDGTYSGNVARFINHRCYDSNLVEIPVQVETPEHHYYRVAFFTTREIKAMDELTWEYGIDFENNHHLLKPFNCLCGSTYCRNNKAH